MWGLLRTVRDKNNYYASRLSVLRGKFDTQVLLLKPWCCHWQQRLFPLETSRGIDVISVRLTRVPAKMYECVNRVTSQLVVWMSNCQHASVESLLQRLFSRGGKMRGYFYGSKHSIFWRTYHMKVVWGKIKCLRFIPDSELRVQYDDDDNTFKLINLRANNDLFMDALQKWF